MKTLFYKNAPKKYPGKESKPLPEGFVAKQSEYWFYISDKQGNMHYSETLEEHQEKIEKYLN